MCVSVSVEVKVNKRAPKHTNSAESTHIVIALLLLHLLLLAWVVYGFIGSLSRCALVSNQ